jgi:uncharacterized repeat protein (TIGR03803 family)
MRPRFAVRKMAILSAALALTVALAMSTAPSAQAQTYTPLHSFTGIPDGQWPYGGLVGDSNGNYYGTSQGGGTSNVGTVFEVNAAGTYSIVHSFRGADGKFPSSTLIIDSQGVLYGTTYAGGAAGIGTVFKLQAGGQGEVTVLYSFRGNPDGRFPVAGLVMDASGNLYGVTSLGGTHNQGTVFKLDGSGNETVLYSFGTGMVGTKGTDGAYPLASLVMDPQGNLYGVTTGGGAHGLGTVFVVSQTGKEKVLHSFTGGSNDGAAPYYAALTRDSSGNLYGTTFAGGLPTGGYIGGEGVAFKVTASGKESVLYYFCSLNMCADGDHPLGGLLQGPNDVFYGTTVWGGYYFGTIFSLTTSGQENWLWYFTNDNYYADGSQPYGPLIQDKSGAFYGTTRAGGSGYHNDGLGQVFKVVP